MSDLTQFTACQLLAAQAAGETTAEEIAEACLGRMTACDDRVGAFLSYDAEAAREEARAIDRKRQAGRPLGLLAGIPIAIKDNICIRGRRTTCASRMLADFRPPYDATIIRRLRDAGAVLLGKTNLDEFAMGSSTENSAFQPTRNPWQLDHAAGGSSGGSAAAVAAAMAPLALGSDTGGSIRQPAAFCGVLGLKPTYGLVSRFGLVAFASSLDQIGPFARSAEDTALLLDAVAGHDPQDATSIRHEAPLAYRDQLTQPLPKLRLGVVAEQQGEGVDPQVRAAVEKAIDGYRQLGAEVREVSLPHGKYAIATYYVIAPCEASSNLARYDGVHYGHRTDEAQLLAGLDAERRELLAAGREAEADELDSPLVRMYRQSRAEGFGPEVKRRIMLGTYALSAGYIDAYYLKALKVRRLIRQDYDRAFEQVDLLVGPCTPTAAFRLGEKIHDPLAMYLGDLFTVGANLAGLPALSLPCGRTAEGLPVGLQLQGPPLSEGLLLQAAHAFQQATDWHRQLPALDGSAP